MALTKAVGKATLELGQQIMKKFAKKGYTKNFSDIQVNNLSRHFTLNNADDALEVETMLKGVKAGDNDMIGRFDEFENTVMAANQVQDNAAEQTRVLGYTRPDAMQNLQQAGLNPPKGGGLTGRKMTPRTIQGPVPPQLADKTFDQGAKSYEEAVMAGTTKFTEDGVPKQIRNYGSDTAPHGRVTGVGVRKTSGRGTFARLEAEKLLTLGDDVKGFYNNKIPGHDDAHHWNPIGIMKKVVDGLPKAKRNKFIQEMQDELGLFSGNHIANLRQLSPDVHRWLHRSLERLGYNPASLKSFKGKSLQARKAYLKKFTEELNKLDEELFSEMQISKGNRAGPKLE